MTAQRPNCNLFVLFGVSVVHYILRVVPQDDAIPPWLNSGKVTDDAIPPWLNSGKVTDDETQTLAAVSF